jgi:flagellar P-ring protein precursor FlgI
MIRTVKKIKSDKLMKRAVAVFICAAFIFNFLSAAYAGVITRIKDIARIGGVRENQLVGYGVVVGLEGSGDKNIMTAQSIVNMLKSFDVTLDPKTLKAQNSAAVMVTANVMPFMCEGDKLDVVVSSIGDAKSIQGGVLLQTPLKGANGKVYAVAQGPVSMGQLGSSQQSAGGVKLHPLVARIPGGAIIEREITSDFVEDEKIEIVLNKKDFSTANAVAGVICDKFGDGFARAKNAGVVTVRVPSSFEDNVVGFLAAVESLSVQTDSASKIVINEKTGTIVMGDDVRISPVAISHNGIKLKVADNAPQQAAQAAPGAGAAQNAPAAGARAVKPGEKNIIYLNAGSTVRDMVDALNEMGAYAKDIIAIIQAMKAAGAIQSDIEVI